MRSIWIDFLFLFLPGRFYRSKEPAVSKFHEKSENDEVFLFKGRKVQFDNGRYYFRFLERIGRVLYLTFFNDGDLVETCALILRSDGDGRRVWFVTDLKYRYRIEHTDQSRSILSVFLCNILSRRLFTVEMINRENSSISHLQQVLNDRGIDTMTARKLHIFDLDRAQLSSAAAEVRKYKGDDIVYLDLRGVRMMRMTSVLQPVKLLHVVPRRSLIKTDSWVDHPQCEYLHRVTCIQGDALDRFFEISGIVNTESAWLLTKNMDNDDFRFLNSSEF